MVEFRAGIVRPAPEGLEEIPASRSIVDPEVARHMRQRGGQILTIATTLAQQPVAGVNAALTNLTKGGLNFVTRALAIEYAAEGIRVNAIASGIVDTPMHKPEKPRNTETTAPYGAACRGGGDRGCGTLPGPRTVHYGRSALR